MLIDPSMHSCRRLALRAACLSVLSAAPAAAQQPAPEPPPVDETLEAPFPQPAAEPSAPLPAPPPPALASTAPQAPTEPPAPIAPQAFPPPRRAETSGPIRQQRRLALTAELGWNGLAGFGPVLTYHVHPHVSFDLAGGFSLFGWKGGLRTRYNFLAANFTPFVGLGANASSGFGEQTFDPADDPNGDPNRDPVTIEMKPSYLLQTTLGFDYVHRRGFTLIGAVGYSFLLNQNNLDVLAGELSAEEKQVVDVLFKSGVVISAAVGYSFE